MDDIYATHTYTPVSSGDPISIVAPFNTSLITQIIDSTASTVQSIDFTKPGNYGVVYTFNTALSSHVGSFPVNVYNKAVSNVKYINTEGFLKDQTYVGDENFLDSIIGEKVLVQYYEPVNNQLFDDVEITEEMLDTTLFDVNHVGPQYIGLTIGGHTTSVDVDVIVDLTEAELVATLTAAHPGLAEMYGETLKLYDNGYGVFDPESERPVYIEYDQEAYAEGFLKTTDINMGGDAYLKVTVAEGSKTGTFNMYIPTGTPAKMYEVERTAMGMEIVVTIHVYGTEGTCWAVCYPDFLGGAPYSTTKVTFKDANTLTFAGEDYVIGTDITDVTPQA